ncbi:hypothetical protein F8388_004847 [Cannabis sativa]|uniref:Tryptophan synthase beta chain-like PALP domain-containing protein n=1 Tax=Cannabis sativa TaxID=3483 RepID=A0A7J6HQ81_CANSA|nr:hypothetical protein F8388_004847 [Cannabis sativa]
MALEKSTIAKDVRLVIARFQRVATLVWIYRAFGAELVLTDPAKGMRGAVAKAEQILAKTPNAYMLQQFENPANPKVHYETTGPEIWRGTGEKADALVAGIGTGDTITGPGKFLKEENPNIKLKWNFFVSFQYVHTRSKEWGLVLLLVFLNSILWMRYNSSKPQIFHSLDLPFKGTHNIVSDFTQRSSDKAIDTAKAHCTERRYEYHQGATAAAAINVAKRPENATKLIVVIFASFGEKYLSSVLFESVKREAESLIDEP